MRWNTITIIALGMTLVTVLNAQTETKFEYKLTSFGNYGVTRVGTSPMAEGIKGFGQIQDQGYADSIIFRVIRASIPEEKLRSLQIGTGYLITFNTTGKVFDVWFILSEQDKVLLTDEDLLNLYEGLIGIRFDTTKVRVVDSYSNSVIKEKGYAFLGGSIKPVEARRYKK